VIESVGIRVLAGETKKTILVISRVIQISRNCGITKEES